MGLATLIVYLLLFLLYAVPALMVVVGMAILFRGKGLASRIIATVLLVVAGSSLLVLVLYRHASKKQLESEKLGFYELTSYPSCYPCTLELQDDNVFVVRNYATIKETGSWSYETGMDYFITHLNEHDQLGYGKYEYTEYKLRYPNRR